ncbi:MAG: FAD binding domain-containing protein [Candidatus Wallbacteria bacterium]|nr:FAD binding domain-containing protein [Candidatus Wallbacteria bacterium]
MKNRIYKPRDRKELLHLMETLDPYQIVNGGTDILVKLKEGKFFDSSLIDIHDLEFLQGIDSEESVLRIGGAVTLSEVARDLRIGRDHPELASACLAVGSPQIRNQGTLAGNVANSSPAGDTIPALLVNEARLSIDGIAGKREIELNAFFTGPGLNILQRGEYIEKIIIPAANGAGVFLKMGQRKALAIAKVSLAVRHDTLFRIALGAVYKTPVLARKTMDYLNNCATVGQAERAQAAEIIRTDCEPITDIRSEAGYRLDMVVYLLDKALDQIKILQTH